MTKVKIVQFQFQFQLDEDNDLIALGDNGKLYEWLGGLRKWSDLEYPPLPEDEGENEDD